uniref:SAP domain-containing protein n=1 Tax=Mycena chlorophos TaxID=658473 RepID=A0ABQ0L741_MYCCL|nr:predicted protein [Mycena chlorophos]
MPPIRGPSPTEELSASVPAPEGVTHAAILRASKAQLRFWIDQANDVAGKKLLKVGGGKEDLCKRLAVHYGFDLSKTAPSTAPVEPPTITAAIIEMQWKDWAEMGREWAAKSARGEPFSLLLEPVMESAFYDGPVASWTPEDDEQLPVSEATTPRNALPTRCPRALARTHTPTPSVPAATCPFPVPVPSTVNAEALALTSLTMVKEGLKRASGLLQVLEQLKSGEVKRIRAIHGPPPGRKRGASKGWKGIKTIITKRERLGEILEEDFTSDEAHFLAYFKMPELVDGKRRRRSKGDDGYRAYRLIVEAWVWCKRHVEKEREGMEYHGPDGLFSETLWNEKWGDMNRWEVWRALGKETYVKPADLEDEKGVESDSDNE